MSLLMNQIFIFRCTPLDMDECSLSVDNCHENSTCVNIDGSFICNCNNTILNNRTVCQGERK